MTALLAVAGGVTALGAAVGVLWRPVRAAVAFLRAIGQFLRDWHGEEARPGFPERPGIPARIERIEGELTLNGGESVKDRLIRIEAQLCEEKA